MTPEDTRTAPDSQPNHPPNVTGSQDGAGAITNRTCGTCTLCCRLMGVEALAKPAGTPCRHCRPGHGCTVYADRPKACHDFNCTWLLDETIPDAYRPDRVHAVLVLMGEGYTKDATHAPTLVANVDPDRRRLSREFSAWLRQVSLEKLPVVIAVNGRVLQTLPSGAGITRR